MQTIYEQLQAMAANPDNNEKLVQLWNRYNGTPTRKIRSNDQETLNLDMRFFSPFHLMQMMQSGQWNPSDRWYIETSDDWKNPENRILSFNDPRDVIDLKDLSEKLIHHKTVLNRVTSKVKKMAPVPHLDWFNFDYLAQH